MNGIRRYLMISVLVISAIYAQDVGSINGLITDIETAESLPGVDVVLKSTPLGAATDVDGYYAIKDVPIGKYTIEVNYIGYATQIAKNIQVFADSVTVVDFTLTPQAIESNPVLVLAARPEVEVNMTQSVRVMRGGKNQDLTETYERVEENHYRRVVHYPLSTFSVDVDGASYANVRRMIVDNELPPPDAVRVEEFVNYFNYDYPQPRRLDPLSVTLEVAECPWSEAKKLVHIGLRGKELKKNKQLRSNLVFLLDVSGSMDEPEKLPLLKTAFKLLIEQLQPDDMVSIVTYASDIKVALPATTVHDKKKIVAALEALVADGGTSGGAGIQLAYQIAAENFIKDGNNRVILATDGDFNIGISDTDELVQWIETKRDEGIFLTALGFGMSNYKDEKLQKLANHGNGHHGYIDNILEAKKMLVNEVNSSLFTIAKDVKLQVEFNPAFVKTYRLIGYENRLLNNEDFEDDEKDAGEVGAGHTVTALYEIELVDENEEIESNHLKYSQSSVKWWAKRSKELLTLNIRYKKPDSRRSDLKSYALKNDPRPMDEVSENFRFAAAVAEFGMILRDSPFKGSANLQHVRNLAKSAIGEDEYGYRSEFLSIVDRVEILSETAIEDGLE